MAAVAADTGARGLTFSSRPLRRKPCDELNEIVRTPNGTASVSAEPAARTLIFAVCKSGETVDQSWTAPVSVTFAETVTF